MSVRIELSPFLRKFVPDYDPAEGLVLDNVAGKKVSDLIEELGIPQEMVHSVIVNRMPGKKKHVIQDGDIIALIMAIAGG